MTNEKPLEEHLIEEISQDFFTYLKAGKLGTKTLQQKLETPNLNINKIKKLFRIHFLLKEDVQSFVEQLPRRVRNIKTSTTKKTETFRGKVKGRISWKQTYSKRYQKNPNSKTLFACGQVEKNYDIAENKVLKKLLHTIKDILENDMKPLLDKERSYVEPWIKSNKKLPKTVINTYSRNVYLRRIKDPEEIKVTEKMLTRVLKSRQEIYKEAAKHLLSYKKIMEYELDPQEAEDLLKNTFIKPNKKETLFELYWIMKIIQQQTKDVELHILDSQQESVVAKWEKEGSAYTLYHDATGRSTFSEKYSDLAQRIGDKDTYIFRQLQVLKELEHLIGKESDSLWGGRPDIILEKTTKQGHKHIFIGEVKYSENDKTNKQGLRELLEYIAHIRDTKKEYRTPKENLFSPKSHIKGSLFTIKSELDFEKHQVEKPQINVISYRGLDKEDLEKIL